MTTNKSSEYVKLENPLLVRRKILEAAIDSTNTLKFFEKYKLIKEKKVSEINSLKKLIRKIKRETSKLNKELPESGFEDNLKEEGKNLQKKTSKKISKVKTLDQELDKIKAKLSKLNI